MTFYRYLTVAADGVVVTSDDDITQVAWFVNDPARAGAAWHVDQTAPFDISGGSVTSAVPFDLDLLGEGTHTVTAVITLADASEVVQTATFEYSPSTSSEPQVFPIESATVSRTDGTSGTPENAFDGLLSTFWSANADNGDAWIRFDLGQAVTLNAVAVALLYGDTRSAQFDVQMSTDGTSWQTVYRASSSGATIDHEHYYFPDQSARYVRLWGYGNSTSGFFSVTEVDVKFIPDPSASLKPPAATLSIPAVESTQVTLRAAAGYGPAESVFRWERATSASGPWTAVATGTTTSVVDDNDGAGLTTGTEYVWRVWAANSAGETVSNVVSATPSVEATVLWFDFSVASLGQQSEADLEQIVQGAYSFRHGGIGTDQTFVTDGTVAGIAPDYDGSKGRILAFRWRWKTNDNYDGNWNGLVRFQGPAPADAFDGLERAQLDYWMMLGSTWENNLFVGKLWGLGGVSPSGSETGPDRPPMHGATVNAGDGWSARRMVGNDYSPKDYIYTRLKEVADEYSGGTPWGLDAWWGADGSTDCSNRHITRGLAPTPHYPMSKQTWYRWRQRVDTTEPWTDALGYTGVGVIRDYVQVNGDWKLVNCAPSMIGPSSGFAGSDANVNCLLAHIYIGSTGNPAYDPTNGQDRWWYIADPVVSEY